MSFKEKNTKYNAFKNSNKNVVKYTLDSKHREKLSEFENTNIKLHKEKRKLNNLIKELNDINELPTTNYTNEIIEKKAKLKTEIEDLTLEINKINNNFYELNYFDNTIDLLLEYYNEPNIQNNDKKVITMNCLFNKNLQLNNTDKSKLYDKYMKIVHNQDVKKHRIILNINICNNCNVEKIIHLTEGNMICPSCGESEFILLDSDKPNFKDSVIENKTCAYKRINHLSEILNQFQAKESTDIDEDIYKTIKNELKIQRIYDYKTLDHKNMKKILKKLKLNKYYEHIHHIINHLNGIPPPCMTRIQEDKIKKIFKDIQKPFNVYRPKYRKNFLNYNYIIHKICELLEYDEFLPFFPLLKSRDKLEEQDHVWEKICNYNKYQFIPSI
jgi:hypothetical protein